MIRINLLPLHIRKKAAERQKVVLVGLLIAVLVSLLIGAYFMKVAKLASLNGDVEKIEKELKKLEPVVKKVADITAKKESLDNKINVIKDLMKTRLLYPVFMDDFASILPMGVWTTSIKTKASGNSMHLSLAMEARDNYGVADLINALESSKKFHNVGFKGITAGSASSGEATRKFSIESDYYPSGEAPKQKAPVKKKKAKKKPKRRR